MSAILFLSELPSLGVWRERLRAYEPRWQIHYASSAAAAESVAVAGGFDVVVSALDGGEAEGLALLRKLQCASPRTARIVLAPSATDAAVGQTRAMAQQVLSPFCEPRELWSVVERTCSLNGLVENAAIRELLGGLERLPSVPRSYVALSQAMAREDVSLEQIVAIVEQDTAMSLKLLQLVNSAFFGRAKKLSSVSRAVSYLGLDMLKALALGAHVFGMIDRDAARAYGLEQLQDRAMLTATLARRFLSARGLAEEGFTAGLLQDVGRLVLAVCVQDAYRAVIDTARVRAEPLAEAERRAFGVTHAEVGAYLMCLWGLPAVLIEAIAFHHAPSSLLHEDTELVDAIHVADAEVEAFAESGERAPPRLDPMLLQRPGMPEQLARWRSMASEQFSELRS